MNTSKKTNNQEKNNTQSKSFDWAEEIAKLINDDKPALWVKTWIPSGLPENLETEKKYNGMNAFFLTFVMAAKGYNDNRFLTFQQAKKAGGNVKKGEKGYKIVFYKEYYKEIDNEEIKFKAIQYYNVFNAEQCENLPAKETIQNDNFVINDEVENIVNKLDVKIINKDSDSAFYDVTNDYIEMPNKSQFLKENNYYYVLMHELIHWSGAKHNLNRGLTGNFYML